MAQWQPQAAEKPFFAALFDISFNNFIMLKMMRFLFILSIIGWGIVALYLVFSALSDGMPLYFLLAPIAFFFGVLLSRLWVETIVVLFRIADNTSRMAGR